MIEISRETTETKVHVRVAVGEPTPERARVATHQPFLDHMLTTLARYAGLNLAISAHGDLRHHVLEDVAITLGLALRDAIPETCQRFGHAVVPMDEALVEATVDTGGRAFYQGRLPSNLYEHFFRSLSENAGFTLHIRVRRGRDRHHVVEAAFKAFGLALAQAACRSGTVFSTKGAVRIERQEKE